MNDEDRFDHIVGQLAALKTFCVAVVATHPDPNALASCLSTLSEVTVAKTLGIAASESMIEGMESVLSDLKHATTQRLARHS
jgi:hypothetical protein